MFSKWQGKVQNEHTVLTWLLLPHSYCSLLYLIYKLSFSYRQPLGILYHVPLDLPSSIFLSTITSASCGLASVVTCSSLGFISSHMMCFSFTEMFRLVFVVLGSIRDNTHQARTLPLTYTAQTFSCVSILWGSQSYKIRAHPNGFILTDII